MKITRAAIAASSALLLCSAFLCGMSAQTAQAKGVESQGYKLHKTKSLWGAKSALADWLKKNPSTEIVAFSIGPSNGVYIISK